jgi:hypothetical protein
MKRTLWSLLALAETVVAFVLAQPAVIIALKIAITASFRRDVFESNAAYFMGMLLGCVIRIGPPAILAWHAVSIVRRRIIQSAIST